MGASSAENGLWFLLTYYRSAIMERQRPIHNYILSLTDAIVEIQKTQLMIRQQVKLRARLVYGSSAKKSSLSPTTDPNDERPRSNL
jgi:hypothetical protein